MKHIHRICARGLAYKDGKLFGQKLQGSTGDWWCTPGGGVEPMESLHDALSREMIEETGIKPDIGRLILVQQFAKPDTSTGATIENLEFFFLIENPDDYLDIDITDTSHGTVEIADFGFIDPADKNMLPTILQDDEVIEAIRNNKPVIFHSNL